MLTLEDRKILTLEVVKFLTAFGYPPEKEDEAISELAEEIRELGISEEEVLAAVNEARKAVRDGQVDPHLFDDDPTRAEVAEMFTRNLPPNIVALGDSPEEGGIRIGASLRHLLRQTSQG